MSAAAYVAGYQPISIADFSGGLNLRDKADTIGDQQAIDLLNVDFTDRGAIRQRDGFENFTPADLTNFVDSLSPYYNAAGVRQLIAGCGTRLEAIDTAGAVVASASGFTRGPWSFVRFGAPGSELLFATNGVDVVQRWDGATWAGITATVDGVAGRAFPKAGALAVTASVPGTTSGSDASNRLVATAFGTAGSNGPNGASTNPSRVYFSNAGQPQVWETDGNAGPPQRGRNYMDLTPGDGEKIQAAVTWRELVFIFKETKFFVLWGEGVGADGTPTFQVREIVNAVGLASPQAVAVGRDGVYFMNRRGVYLTNGNDPALLSDIITPLWEQDPEIYFKSKPLNLARLDLVRMLWHQERLYLAIPTGPSNLNDRVLVYDTQHRWWSLYDVPAAALASFRATDRPNVFVGYSGAGNPTTRKRIGSFTADRETDHDPLVPMVSRWRSGWGDYGSSQQRTFRETRLWGTGAVNVAFSVNYNELALADEDALFSVSLDWPLTGSVSWDEYIASANGNWPGGGQIAERLVRIAMRGFVFSTEFSSSPRAGTWSVHRVARHLREIRAPSMR